MLLGVAGALGATTAVGSAAGVGTARAAEPRPAAPEVVVVTASRVEEPLASVPAHVTVIDRAAIERSPALTLDDLLREVPGFGLFRRSSSLVAQPTTQGVSLRGLGPTGAGRTLVLVDGVPVNDPFGGWVYWSRIPLDRVERVEIVRGGAASAWGNYALGGVVHIVTRTPDERGARAQVEAGSFGTVEASAAVADAGDGLVAELRGDVFRTDGYPVTRPEERGPVDVPPTSEHFAGGATAVVDLTADTALVIDAGYFDEDRGNGTPGTANATRTAHGHARASGHGAGDARWNAVLFGQLQGFEATFTSVSPDRTTEQPALDQFSVPSSAVGGSFTWSTRLAAAHRIVAGTDARHVVGTTNEDFRFVAGSPTRRRTAGGDELLAGAFAQHLYEPARWLAVASALRVDAWRLGPGERRERSLEDDGVTRFEESDARVHGEVDPTVGVVLRPHPAVALRASGYRAFRAPTLNELYRPFRVGNDVTEANAGLDAETLWGGEAGVAWATGGLALDVTGYWNRIDDPILNVTVADGPGTIEPCGFVPEGGTCRQRRNLDRARVRGVEADAAWSPTREVTLWARWLYADTRIERASEARELEGRRLAQVPLHTVTAGARVAWPPGTSLALDVRWTDDQFEDDRNTRVLGDYVVVGASARHTLADGLALVAGVENLLDRRYEAGEAGDGRVTLGAPLFAHGGIEAAW